MRREGRERDPLRPAFCTSELRRQVSMQRPMVRPEACGERRQVEFSMMPACEACRSDAVADGDALA